MLQWIPSASQAEIQAEIQVEKSSGNSSGTSSGNSSQSQPTVLPQRSSYRRLLLGGLIGLSCWLVSLSGATAHEGYGDRSSRSTRSTADERPPAEFQPGTLGVCRLYNLSGYLAIDAAGQVVPLSQYCQQQHNWVWYQESDFWDAFRDVASPAVLDYTQTLDRHQVEAYANSICDFLSDRTLDRQTLQQNLQQIQSDQQLLPDFERAVTRAAVKAYCPHYRSSLN